MARPTRPPKGKLSSASKKRKGDTENTTKVAKKSAKKQRKDSSSKGKQKKQTTDHDEDDSEEVNFSTTNEDDDDKTESEDGSDEDLFSADENEAKKGEPTTSTGKTLGSGDISSSEDEEDHQIKRDSVKEKAKIRKSGGREEDMSVRVSEKDTGGKQGTKKNMEATGEVSLSDKKVRQMVRRHSGIVPTEKVSASAYIAFIRALIAANQSKQHIKSETLTLGASWIDELNNNIETTTKNIAAKLARDKYFYPTKKVSRTSCIFDNLSFQ